MSVVASQARDLAGRVLTACGGGRSLHIGPDAADAARAFRAHALDARVVTGEADRVAAALEGIADQSFDLVAGYDVLDAFGQRDGRRIFDEMLRVTRRAVLLTSHTRSRDAWERECLSHACRKHPLHQLVVPYQGLDWQGNESTMLFERLPLPLTIGASIDELAPMRDLHMDMLREAGRRSDAHVARYMLARQFVRPRDRVLDGACGLGYGAAILADGTLADRVLGLDADTTAIQYAREHFGQTRARLAFEPCDLSNLSAFDAGAFDVVVSFETLEHLADPDGFVAACRRILTPAGRLICSVPNRWVDESGRDPNPHHLHVFDRERLEKLCRRHLAIEHVFGQTAGGGMKLPEAGRDLWNADDSSQDAEWWLLVGMLPVTSQTEVPFRSSLLDCPEDDRTNVLAFERDYDNPWLAKALITIGLRTESKTLLERVADDVLTTDDGTGASTADRGAALCVKAYRRIDAATPLEADLVDAIHRYCAETSDVPHVIRWQISLRYAEAMSCLQQGSSEYATLALEACASADALAFSPLLATKTVGAAFLRGWLAAQALDEDTARRWWNAGLDQAERALSGSWDELLLSRRAPALFGMREATAVADLASRCAAGLHLLPHLGDRPGLVLSQLFDSLGERASRARKLERQLEDARAEIARLRNEARAAALVGGDRTSVPSHLKIAVFGAGTGGRRALASLRARGASVTCVADNDSSRHGLHLDGVPIVDPATLRSHGVDMVAVASLPGRAAIFAQLEGLGYRIGRDTTFVGG